MLRPLAALASALFVITNRLPPPPRKPRIYSGMDAVHPVWAKQAMVSVQEKVAAEVGLQVLRDGWQRGRRRRCRGAGAGRHPAAGRKPGRRRLHCWCMTPKAARPGPSTTARWRRRVRRATCISMPMAMPTAICRGLSGLARRRARHRGGDAAGARHLWHHDAGGSRSPRDPARRGRHHGHRRSRRQPQGAGEAAQGLAGLGCDLLQGRTGGFL